MPLAFPTAARDGSWGVPVHCLKSRAMVKQVPLSDSLTKRGLSEVPPRRQ